MLSLIMTERGALMFCAACAGCAASSPADDVNRMVNDNP
jgi:hypothetical protein